MNKVYLVRHGENPANITEELSCRKVDYSLTAKGRLQAQQTAEYFEDKSIDLIYASPLKRAFETAQIIGERLGLTPVIIEGLREINVGRLEGMPDRNESWRIHNKILYAWIEGNTETKFPGGEDLIMSNARMRNAMQLILSGNDGRRIVVVGHGGLFFTSIGVLCQDTRMQDISAQASHNCSISELEIELNHDQMQGTLLRWADDSHMHDEAADFVLGYRL
jgi:broad specificity phosphatase PhoE